MVWRLLIYKIIVVFIIHISGVYKPLVFIIPQVYTYRISESGHLYWCHTFLIYCFWATVVTFKKYFKMQIRPSPPFSYFSLQFAPLYKNQRKLEN